MKTQYKYDWSAVDWTAQDIDIATQLGCTRQRVQQVRHELRKPDSPRKHQFGPTSLGDHVLPILRRYAHVFEIVACQRFLIFEAGLDQSWASRLATELPQKIGKCDRINWRLPNVVIEEIWGCTNAGSLRQAMGFPPSRWRMNVSADRASIVLRGEIEAERKSASAYFAARRRAQIDCKRMLVELRAAKRRLRSTWRRSASRRGDRPAD